MAQERKRNFYKEAILKIVKFLNNADDDTTEDEINTQYDRLMDSWRFFQDVHLQILEVTGDEFIDFQNAEFDAVDDMVITAIAKFKFILKKFVTKPEEDFESAHSKIGDDVTKQHGGLRVPYFKIPLFAGDYDAWPAFRDLFRSLIHFNNKMSPVQKLGYLKVNVTGEALQIIKNLEITDANYDTAWELLADRYDNERILVNRWIRLIVSLPISKGEAADIKAILDGTLEALQGLKNLNRPIDGYDDFLVYLTETKLDSKSKQKWEDEIADDNNCAPTWNKMVSFLKARFRSLEVGTIKSISTQDKAPNRNNYANVSKSSSSTKSFSVESSTKSSQDEFCLFCKKKHRLNFCFSFQKKPRNERQAFVDEKKLCTNCLNSGHKFSSCPSTFTCRICKLRHNTLLHDGTNQSSNTVAGHLFGMEISSKQHSLTLLATALIHIETMEGVTVQLRALIDQGSQISFISSSVANRLGMRGKIGGPSVKSVGSEKILKTNGIANIEFASQYNPDCKFQVTVTILDVITGQLPSEFVDICLPKHWKQLSLADPNFFKPGPINVLLGADVFHEIIEKGLLRMDNNGIIAQKSALGWLLSGKVKLTSPIPVVAVCNSTDEDPVDVHNQLKAFWEIEDIGTDRKMDPDDQFCDDYYNETHYRNQDGRYVVRLPFKPGFGNFLHLGNSRNRALYIWMRKEDRLEKFPEKRRQYNDIMSKLLEMKYMEVIPSSELDIPSGESCYLPHHMVTRSGKNRIVFNASQKTSSGYSLNDTLLAGPPLQKELFDIILHVRQFSVAFTADVVKMFRQFLINKLDVNYQRIVWRKSKYDPIQDYRLLTVLDGTTCAPYLAIKTIQTMAKDERSKYPLACEIAERDLYMDDLFSGAHDIQSALVVRDQLISLFQSAGMELKKWSSNKKEFLDSLSSEFCEIPVNFGDDDMVKTLGVYWSPVKDEFGYRIRINGTQTNITKRQLLSEASRLFDPVGWVAPCIIIPKMLFQSLWSIKLDWDDPLPKEIEEKWLEFRQQLLQLEKIKIPRWSGNHKIDKLIELHGFSDASERAYAAVVFIKVVDLENNITVTLLSAKTKVAPIKTISLPRLELCGALLLAQLLEKVVKAMHFPEVHVHAHTDSRIVLAWLQSQPSRWKTFVANRTSEILRIVPANHWHYVKSNENPADCASRGQNALMLSSNSLWWNGPTWLKDFVDAWPNSNQIIEMDLDVNMEKRRNALVVSNIVVLPAWDLKMKFSSLNKLLRVSAYCWRFVNNCRNPGNKITGYLTTDELKMVLQYWIKVTQETYFKDEIDCLENEEKLSNNSSLLRLSPMLDKYGVLRVGGRLTNSDLPFERQHPIILPKHDNLTNLIIDHTHKLTLHGGIQLMLNCVRDKYWILNARSAVREYFHKCNKCYRFSAKNVQQMMADLPVQRVTPSRPFTHCAVDYAGPIKIRIRKGPGKPVLLKGYISIFVCMATKAVHLELVGDLTSDAFIAAFKRFISRKGKVSDVYSDNGSNFLGAVEIMSEAHRLAILNIEKEFAELLANDGINWHFSPPSAPHFNGLAEAGVRSVKYHLRRIVGSVNLIYEELYTVLCQIECVLNSRPISALTDEFSDFAVLTPGHFLMGSAPMSVPEPMLLDINENRLARWQLVEKMHQDFWKSWSSEYLTSLQTRQKWKTVKPNLMVGQLVLIREDNLPPTKWHLGRIIEVHPGQDGLVRAATVKTQTSILKRPIVKLCPLPSNQLEASDALERNEN